MLNVTIKFISNKIIVVEVVVVFFILFSSLIIIIIRRVVVVVVSVVVLIWLFAECSLNPPASTLRLPRVSYAIPTHTLTHSMAAAGVATLLTSMIIVQNAGTETVNGQYFPQDPAKIPYGFDLVCKQNNWNTLELWKKLNGNSVWYEKEDGAYVYYNNGDRRWWIDDKDGLGVYIADTDGSNAAKKYPLRSGYEPLQNAIASTDN